MSAAPPGRSAASEVAEGWSVPAGPASIGDALRDRDMRSTVAGGRRTEPHCKIDGQREGLGNSQTALWILQTGVGVIGRPGP